MGSGPKPNVIGLDHPRRSVVHGKLGSSPRRYPLAFYSILFASPDDRYGDDALPPPEFFPDLNCDQIVDAVTAGKDEYNLKPYFYAGLQRADAIKYRQEVMQDLESSAVYDRVSAFAGKMRDVRSCLARAEKAYYKQQKEARFIDAVNTYCDAINTFGAVRDSACGPRDATSRLGWAPRPRAGRVPTRKCAQPTLDHLAAATRRKLLTHGTTHR
jgi:hypothetical protein